MIRNNKGFSFIELLVVIAIVAVMMTVAIGGMGYLNRTNAKKAVSTVQSTLTLVRNKSIAYKNPWKCEIKMESSGQCDILVYEYKGIDADSDPDWQIFSTTSLGNIQNIELAFYGSTNPAVLNRGTPASLEFSFKNSTGAFDKLTKELGSPAADAVGTSFATLKITTTANNTATMKLYFVSGKVEIV